MMVAEELTHTDECIELLGEKSPTLASVPTMYRLTKAQKEIVFACPHWAHDIPRQMEHR